MARRAYTTRMEHKRWRSRFERSTLDENRDDRDTTNGEIRSCYKLNLNARGHPSKCALKVEGENGKDIVVDDDAGTDCSPLETAIRTARIFNGIVVDDDGILLSRSERANRESDYALGKTLKEGQSRQAVKIERIIRASETRSPRGIGVRKHPNFPSDETDDTADIEQNNALPRSQLLVVLGEYDDITRLVSKGAEKLRSSKSISWLPHSVLSRTIEFCSTKDAMNLSQSCKLMRQTITTCTNYQAKTRTLRRALKQMSSRVKAQTNSPTQGISNQRFPNIEVKTLRNTSFKWSKRGRREKSNQSAVRDRNN